jgi:hypothetical protein
MSKGVVYDFLSIEGLDLAGDPDTWGVWTGPDNITIDVISGTTVGVVSRSFVGGGTLLKVPQIVDAIGIDARNKADFEVSQINTYTRDMVFGANLRGARVTMNRGRRNSATNAWIADPEVLFVGRVDSADGQVGAVGGEGAIVISCRPDTIDLNVTNPAMKSDESTQELFGGDRFRRYDVAQLIVRKWGMIQGSGKSKAK